MMTIMTTITIMMTTATMDTNEKNYEDETILENPQLLKF